MKPDEYLVEKILDALRKAPDSPYREGWRLVSADLDKDGGVMAELANGDERVRYVINVMEVIQLRDIPEEWMREEIIAFYKAHGDEPWYPSDVAHKLRLDFLRTFVITQDLTEEGLLLLVDEDQTWEDC